MGNPGCPNEEIGVGEPRIESQAFRRATLSSESYQIVWLLCILAALTLAVIARDVAAGKFRLLYAQLVVLALAIAYESFALARVKKALRKGQDISRAIRLVNVVVEAAL